MASELRRAPASRARALRLLGGELRRNADPEALVRGHVAVYGSGSASEELMRAAAACAEQHDVALVQHQSLDARDAAFDRNRFGRDPLVHLREIGVLGARCSFMHMNVLTPAERDAIQEVGMNVIWHPGNFLFYGLSANGPSPAPELIRRGVSVALGADIAKAWTFSETSLFAFLVARMQGEDLSPEVLLRILTRNGARAAGLLHCVGTLETGKRADVVVRRTDLPEAQPNVDPLRQLVLVSRTKSVRTVIVDGRIVVDDGHAVTVDEEQVYTEARRSALLMASRVGVEVPSPPAAPT
jgi:cytosine/adenosine deaminase-related metal-dependent hydrolase